MQIITSLPYFEYNDLHLEERISPDNVLVYKGRMMDELVAMKVIECNRHEIPHEVEVHSILHPHPNIIPLLGAAHAPDGFSIYTCMELADTSLFNYLHRDKMKPSLQQSTKWAIQIAEGMHHIHQHGLTHCDLKSAHVLLFEKENIIKICDFGSAQVLEGRGSTGTYHWMVPGSEVAEINRRCDVFSYGMILFEIFVHQIPFADIEAHKVVSLIQQKEHSSIPPEVPAHIKDLMKSCWKYDAHDHPTFEKILHVG